MYVPALTVAFIKAVGYEKSNNSILKIITFLDFISNCSHSFIFSSAFFPHNFNAEYFGGICFIVQVNFIFNNSFIFSFVISFSAFFCSSFEIN
jgi:hypothetical protein